MPDAAAAAVAAWAQEARSLAWDRGWTRAFEPDGAQGRWFAAGRLNVALNCVDRHLEMRGDRVALHWEGEPGDRLSLTYSELHAQVGTFAAALHRLGVGPGDRVALYLGMIPETIVAMLACARLGAVHCLLFSVLPPDALADRLHDLDPKVLVTQDGSWRHGVVLPLKARADEALAATTGVQHTVVVRRTGIDVGWFAGDRWYHELMSQAGGMPVPDAVAVDADHPLFVVHLANRRGRPAGIVHRSGGLLAYARTLHRGLTTSIDDVFWCAVDIGWIAGQSHGVYGALASGGTTVVFEGTLDTPTHARAWQIIERYRVAAVLTTPSIVRNLRQWADSPPSDHDLASLQLIVTAGEAIDPASAAWLSRDVGRGRALLRDGWGQTELGAVVTVNPPPHPALPDPGLDVVGDGGAPLPEGAVGELVLRHPWPATFLGVRNDDGQATRRYWARAGAYATGDAARREADGSVTVLGRLDPVVSVSGQLVSAREVREVLEDHPFVAGAEVVGRRDRRSGQAVVACVLLDEEAAATSAEPAALEALAHELRRHVHDTLGGLAEPRTVAFLDRLPKDLPRAALRRALSVLASANESPVIRVTPERLLAAVTAGGSVR